MNYQKHQKIFWATLLTALLVDSSFDLFAWRETAVTAATGDAVVRSYVILDHVSGLGAALRENLQGRIAGDAGVERQSLVLLQEHYLKLLRLTTDNPAQQQVLRSLDYLRELNPDDTLRIRRNFEQIGAAAVNIRKMEEGLLEQRMAQDREANRTSRLQIILASLLDMVLLLAAGGLWYLKERSQRAEKASLFANIASAQKSNAELQELLSHRTRLYRSTVHDLKNPLGSIRGFSDLLQEDRNNPESVAEMSQVLQRISDHTLALVNSLMLTETSAAHAKEEVSLPACLEEAMASLKPQLLKKNQSFDCSPWGDFLIHGERKSLLDLFINLLGNASKFSPLGSAIELRVVGLDGKVRVEIEDDGPGFTSSDKAHAFTPFTSLSAQPTGGESSSGLGLSIVKGIVDAHSGSITVSEGLNGRGALITVELPL